MDDLLKNTQKGKTRADFPLYMKQMAVAD